LRYKSKIKINEDVNLIWNIASVNIPVKLENKLLPVNIVSIWNSNIWSINILVDGSIEKKEVLLWDIYGELIEVKEILDDNINIITTYVDNFDPEKFNLKVKSIDE
jgi:hypothetical protein